MPEPKKHRPSRSHYAEIAELAGGEHPVDVAVRRRAPQEALRAEIRGATEELVDALGERRNLWLRLEELRGDYHLCCEEAYFDIGFDYGRIAGRREALQRGGGDPEVAEMARRFEEAALAAGLEPGTCVPALLEVAWALATGHPGEAPAGSDDAEPPQG